MGDDDEGRRMAGCTEKPLSDLSIHVPREYGGTRSSKLPSRSSAWTVQFFNGMSFKSCSVISPAWGVALRDALRKLQSV